MQGKIMKGIAGFYYVHIPGKGVYECKAKGIFRKDNMKPLVGDDVEMEITHEADMEGNIIRILPRRNALIRPAVSNIDQAIIIFAITKPEPNYNLLDRFLIMMRQQGLDCVICFNKRDIATREERRYLESIYENSGCQVIFTSAMKKEGIEKLQAVLHGKTTAVAGPSGVGKSSLINCLQSTTHMQTGAISKKIDRGKHTTRHTELIAVEDNTYIMDTPGFSSLAIQGMEKEELRDYYPEFTEYERYCRFQGCSHIHEPDCAVKDALEEGKISKIRYDNYQILYEELKEKEKRRY